MSAAVVLLMWRQESLNILSGVRLYTNSQCAFHFAVTRICTWRPHQTRKSILTGVKLEIQYAVNHRSQISFLVFRMSVHAFSLIFPSGWVLLHAGSKVHLYSYQPIFFNSFFSTYKRAPLRNLKFIETQSLRNLFLCVTSFVRLVYSALSER